MAGAERSVSEGSTSVVTQYRPVKQLASGGMGTVSVCVRQTGTFERLYAVKRLHPHLREDPDMRSMFLDEARMAGLLRHANVVPVLDVGEDADGPFLVMDYVEGVSLARFVRHHASTGDLVPIPLCVHIAAQIARGLHAAHELVDSEGRPLHLVHRDVSPQNVLIGNDGVVRVTDFGVAKALGRSTHTSTGLLKGKVGYMAPEHLRFEPLDRRTDLFALGVVLVELLTSQRLFPGQDAAAVARAILDEPAPDVGDLRPDAPPALVELAFHLLAKNPDERPPTAAEVADRLEEIAAEEGPVDLAGYVTGRFGQELDEARTEIREAAAELQTRLLGLTSLEARVPQAPEPIESASRGWVRPTFAVAALALVGGLLWWRTDREPELQVDVAESASISTTVVVHVESRPAGATVRVRDEVQGTTPLDLTLDRGEAAVELQLELADYERATHSVVPIANERLVVALTPAVAPVAGEPEVVVEAPPEPEAQPRRETKRRTKPRSKPKSSEEPERPVFRRFD